MWSLLLAVVAQVAPGAPSSSAGAPAPRADRLDDAFRTASELRSCSARYVLFSTTEPAPIELQIEFVAPSRVRVDRIAGGKSSTMWCIDGELAMESTAGPQPARGRADSAAVARELAPIETALAKAFPHARPRAQRCAAIGMGWGFDTETNKASFAVEAVLREAGSTPLGWLETLRRKRAVPVVDGTLLRFVTDGHCRIALAADSAFVQSFDAESPQGRLHLELAGLSTNHAVDPARFALPAPAAGFTDVSESLMRALRRQEELDLRGRVYEAIASAPAGPPWTETELSAVDSVLVPFHARAVVETLAGWIDKSAAINATLAERLRKLRAEGQSPDEVEAARRRELGYLTKQLDELEQGFLSRTSVPTLERELLRGEQLLAREKQVIARVFGERVRAPVLAAFESATRP